MLECNLSPHPETRPHTPNLTPHPPDLTHTPTGSAIILLGQRLKPIWRSSPMPTDCSPDLFSFGMVEGRAVWLRFDGGAITIGRGCAATGRDRSRHPPGRAVRRLLRGRPGAGRGWTRRRDHGRPAGGRVRLGIRGPGRPRSAARTTPCWRCWPASSRPGEGLVAARRQEHAQPLRRLWRGPLSQDRATIRLR